MFPNHFSVVKFCCTFQDVIDLDRIGILIQVGSTVGPAKPSAFLLVTSAGIILVGNQSRVQKVFNKKVKPLIAQHSDRIKDIVSNSTSRSKEVIPAPIFQGVLGVSAVSLSSTFTLVFLSNIPGHGDREAIKYWQDLFGRPKKPGQT